MNNKFVVIDLETTGNAPKKGDKIIQFAAVVIEGGKIVEQFSSLVNPEQPIPPFIEELTGLSDDMVKAAPLFKEIAPAILTLLDNAYFVAHNVFFDLSFLQEELLGAGFNGFYGPVLDTVELARILFPTADSYKLSDLAIKEDLTHDRPHQADSDAYVTAELLLILLNRLQQLPGITLRQLAKLSGGLKSELQLLLDERNLLKEKSIEELADTIEVHRGIALKKHSGNLLSSCMDTKVEFPAEDNAKEELLNKAFPAYERRTGQFKMMDSVYESFSTKQRALIEAGTGVGKSLAYLIPAVLFAKQHEERVVVSTYTTQLQDQLLAKDIPLLKKMFSFPVKTVLLKGRNHYISLAKFAQSLRETDDNYDTILTKMQILVWLTETETGDNDELNLSSGGMIYWNRIKNDAMVFLQEKSWQSHDFYMRARNEALTSDLIITNHALLLTDLAEDHSVLPDYDYVVIDEAHHLEKAAGKQFGFSLDYLSVRILLGKIGQYEQKQLFYRLEQLISSKGIEDQNLLHTFELNQLFSDLLYETDQLFKAITMYAKKAVKEKKVPYNRIYCRLSHTGERIETGLAAVAERFSFMLRDFIHAVEKRLNVIKTKSLGLTTEESAFLEEMSSLVEEMEQTRQTVKEILISPLQDYVSWIEMDKRAVQNATTVYAQPVTVSHFLREKFFAVKNSVILTSATLTVNHSFQYMVQELGLDGFGCRLKLIPSPFRYEEQVKLIIPQDLPEINTVPLDEYIAAIGEHIITIAEATRGRMLILFTSYDMLKRTYELIKESGFLEDFAIIAQGISSGSRTRLTRNFQRFDKAILLGTSSFWEGVDIPGEDLSCLIIVRLPFSPPDEPLTEAKCERIKQTGGNPFADYSLPEAVLRFKQGFGRLIRTSTDRGFIVVFDRRMITTKYGKAFLKSVPAVPIIKSNLDDLVILIDSWL